MSYMQVVLHIGGSCLVIADKVALLGSFLNRIDCRLGSFPIGR